MYSKRHINDFHVADLSHIVSIDIPIWPEDPAVEVRGHASFETEGFALNEWIHSTFDHMFVLPKKHVLTMTEVEDVNIQNFYKTINRY